jgi:hypothetical protein
MISGIGNMFDQQEQQGWFGTKWPLWVFVVVFLFGDIPFRVIAYSIREHFGLGETGELVIFGVICFAVVGLTQGYNARKERLRRGN